MWKGSALAGAQRLLAGWRGGRRPRGKLDSMRLAGSQGSSCEDPAQDRNTIRFFDKVAAATLGSSNTRLSGLPLAASGRV